MGFAKIFKFAKKGSKKVRKSKGGGAAAPVKWPDGIRVGVFGHENSGKTVFFTSLYTKSKSTKDFQNWKEHDPILYSYPGTWDGAHLWAPNIFEENGTYYLLYTGLTSNCA